MIFTAVLIFCAGLCTGVTGILLYLTHINQEEENYAETRKS